MCGGVQFVVVREAPHLAHIRNRTIDGVSYAAKDWPPRHERCEVYIHVHVPTRKHTYAIVHTDTDLYVYAFFDSQRPKSLSVSVSESVSAIVSALVLVRMLAWAPRSMGREECVYVDVCVCMNECVCIYMFVCVCMYMCARWRTYKRTFLPAAACNGWRADAFS